MRFLGALTIHATFCEGSLQNVMVTEVIENEHRRSISEFACKVIEREAAKTCRSACPSSCLSFDSRLRLLAGENGATSSSISLDSGSLRSIEVSCVHLIVSRVIRTR
jgi:hypothetical protein